jgi:hypothetical protein
MINLAEAYLGTGQPLSASILSKSLAKTLLPLRIEDVLDGEYWHHHIAILRQLPDIWSTPHRNDRMRLTGMVGPPSAFDADYDLTEVPGALLSKLPLLGRSETAGNGKVRRNSASRASRDSGEKFHVSALAWAAAQRERHASARLAPRRGTAGSIHYGQGLWVVCNDSDSRPFDVIVRGVSNPLPPRTTGDLHSPRWAVSAPGLELRIGRGVRICGTELRKGQARFGQPSSRPHQR